MSTPNSESPPPQAPPEAALARLTSSDTFVRAKEGVSRLIGKYPATSVVGAFAVGFALAKLFRSLRED